MGHERCEHAQAGAFVNDAVQPVVCEAGNVALLAAPLTQEAFHIQTAARLRPTVGRRRTEYPSARARESEWRSPRPGRRVRPSDTRRRPQTFAAAKIGTRRIPPN